MPNEWAPVRESIAGPCIFVSSEGVLVQTSVAFGISERVAFAQQSRMSI